MNIRIHIYIYIYVLLLLFKPRCPAAASTPLSQARASSGASLRYSRKGADRVGKGASTVTTREPVLANAEGTGRSLGRV